MVWLESLLNSCKQVLICELNVSYFVPHELEYCSVIGRNTLIGSFLGGNTKTLPVFSSQRPFFGGEYGDQTFHDETRIVESCTVHHLKAHDVLYTYIPILGTCHVRTRNDARFKKVTFLHKNLGKF